MKINAVISKPNINRRINELDSFERSLFAIFAIMLTSILAGALAYKTKSSFFESAVFESFVAFSTNLTGKSFFEAFSGFFAVDLSVLIILTLLGVSAFGEIPIISSVFFRVLGIGTLGAYLFDRFDSSGFKYFLLIILPGRIFMFFALLIAVQNCFQTSRKVRHILNGNSTETVDYRVYLIRNVIALSIFALGSLTDTLLLRFVSQHLISEL